MKRVYNDVALKSILYLLPGSTGIIIEDYPRAVLFMPWEAQAGPVGRWEGEARDIYKIPDKYLRAKVYSLDLSPEEDPGTVYFKISTDFEQY